MATPLLERGAKPTPTVLNNARESERRRQKRPIPATRHDADQLYAPGARTAHSRAMANRLYRLNVLGLLHPEGRPITNAEAHQLILDALYPCDQGASE